MKLLSVKISLVFVLLATNNNIAMFAQQSKLPIPNKQQLAWQQAEFGFIFHYDLHVFDSSKYSQTYNRITPIPRHNIFNPTQLNVEQWILAAKEAGAKFAILTATHETGFALYQSDVNPYSLKAVKWRDGKGDIVKDFVEACRKHGIQPGIYLGIRWNSFFGVHDFKVEGTGQMQKNRQSYYNKMAEGMVEEICTRYGPLFQLWFDGGASSPEKAAPDVLPIVKKYQPDCLFYHNDQLAEARWGGSESGTVGYPCWSTFPYNYTGSGESAISGIAKNGFALLKHGDSLGKYWMPAMADAPLRGHAGRHEWFWEPGDEKHIYPLEDLMEMYYRSVGRNATLIIGLTPDPSGLLPATEVKRLKEWGEEIRNRFDSPLATTQGKGNKYTISLDKLTPIHQVIIQEDIALGERIRNYRVEALVNNKWQEVCAGSSIGHKRIQMFTPVQTRKLRLTIIKSIAEPRVLSFKAYNINNKRLVNN